MVQTRSLFRFGLILTLALALAVGLFPAPSTASARAKPFIAVSPTWIPTVQLTTIDPNNNKMEDFGDDFRYVEAEIKVEGNVPFWTMNLTCTANPNIVEYYEDIDGGTHDDRV